MGNRAFINRITKINELKAEIEELQAQMDGLKDELKEEMTNKGTDEIRVGDYTVRYKEVTSTSLDSKKLKLELPDVYGMYARLNTTKRFTIA